MRVVLTSHASQRIEERVAEPGLELRGKPYVRVLEIWDREAGRVLYGMLANRGSLLLGDLDRARGEFTAITLLTAAQLHVTGRGKHSRLIPRSAELYEIQ